jgi:opacity protein-like surface antigen
MKKLLIALLLAFAIARFMSLAALMDNPQGEYCEFGAPGGIQWDSVGGECRVRMDVMPYFFAAFFGSSFVIIYSVILLVVLGLRDIRDNYNGKYDR